MWNRFQRGFSITIVAIGWLLTALIGCSDTNKLTSPPAIPEVLKSGDHEWFLKGELSDDDRLLLERYFRQHLSEIDNPIFEERVVVYRNQAGARRFYWFTMMAKGTRWFFLEFDLRNRFRGSGEGVSPESAPT